MKKRKTADEILPLVKLAEQDIAAGMTNKQAIEKHSLTHSQFYSKRSDSTKRAKGKKTVIHSFPIASKSSELIMVKGSPQSIAELMKNLDGGGNG